MLHEFLSTNRTELVDLCKSKVAARRTITAIDANLESGIPSFIDQLIKTLEVEQTSEPMKSRKVSGPSGGGPAYSEIDSTAARHGRELLEHGYTVEQVVHDYGDLCQAVSELAVSHQAPIRVEEFQTLNRCLDNGIASAVKEFGFQRDLMFANGGVRSSNQRLGMLAHELRNLIHSASLAMAAMKTGYVGLGGVTAGVLERSLTGMATLIDRSLADVRVTAGLPARREVISLEGFISEIGAAASLQADAWDCRLLIGAVDPALGIAVDRELLSSAMSNLLQNAFKFTHAHSEVSLRAYGVDERVLIEVEDHCGGLPPGDAQHLFDPFTQVGADRSGLGLGLAISKRGVEENLGVLSVRDLPGKGCVFSVDLPRHVLPPIATVPAVHSIQ